MLKKLFIGLSVCGAVSGGSYTVWYNNLVTNPMDVKISHQIKYANDPLKKDIRLFQYHNCPFSSKVRAYLDIKGIGYKIIEVNSLTRGEIRRWSNYKKVPILVTEENGKIVQINDSSVIISVLESYILNNKKESLSNITEFYQPFINKNNKTDFRNKFNLMFLNNPVDEKIIMSETKYRKWVDNTFVHVISPNVYRSFDEAVETFNYFSDVGDWNRIFGIITSKFIIYSGAIVMYIISKKLKVRYGLNDDVRIDLFKEGKLWSKGLGKRRFMGGSSPSISDISFFGMLTSFEGCQAFKELMQQDPILLNWYTSMKSCLHEKVDMKKSLAFA